MRRLSPGGDRPSAVTVRRSARVFVKVVVSPMKIRVLLADSRRLFREGMCALLERVPDIKVVGASEEGPAAAKLAQALSPDVALVNLTLAAYASRSLIEGLRAASPRTRVVALTLSPSTSFIQEILSAGASG